MLKSHTARIFSPGAETEITIQECGCGTRIDVSRYEPLQELICPGCGKNVSVLGSIDRFALESIAGRGGVGIVYQAFDPHLGRNVALKVVRHDKAGNDEALQQMAIEAGVTASINHPHVVRVYSVGNSKGRVFIAMEIIRGGSLDELLEKRGKLPESQVLDLGIQVASGLEAAQRAGLIHRDIKPGNILFADPKTAKVVDFGLALFEKGAVAASEIWGTPYYLPPERLQGIAEDFRSDIYALGATLFHAITGRPPFEGPNGTAVAMKRLNVPPPSVLTFAPDVSNSTAFVLKKMMEREPAERFQSYDELVESLQFARNELGSLPTAKARVVLRTSEGNAGMWVTLVSIAVLILACVGGYFLLRKSGSAKAPALASQPVPAAVEQKPAPVEAPKSTLPKVETKPEVAKASPAAFNAASAAAKAADTGKVAPVTFGAAMAPVPGVYILVNRKSGEVLECPSAVMTNGTEVTGAKVTRGYHQRWMVKNSENGGSRLLAFYHGKALEVRNGSSDDNASISLNASRGDTKQCWRFRQTEPGWAAIVAEGSGKALTLEAGRIFQREYAGKPEQQWRLEMVEPLPAGIDVIDPAVTPDLPSMPPVTAKAAQVVNPRFIPLNLASVATADSRKGMYSTLADKQFSPRPILKGLVDVAGVSFTIVNPDKTATGKDNVTLRGGTGHAKTGYPMTVEIPVGGVPLSRLHVVGGVGGWAYPYRLDLNPLGALAAKITVLFRDGSAEEILLRSGYEIMDHHDPGAAGVPGSAKIEWFTNTGRQLRYFYKPISGTGPVQTVVLESFDQHVAPTFFSITGEKR